MIRYYEVALDCLIQHPLMTIVLVLAVIGIICMVLNAEVELAVEEMEGEDETHN